MIDNALSRDDYADGGEDLVTACKCAGIWFGHADAHRALSPNCCNTDAPFDGASINSTQPKSNSPSTRAASAQPANGIACRSLSSSRAVESAGDDPSPSMMMEPCPCRSISRSAPWK